MNLLSLTQFNFLTTKTKKLIKLFSVCLMMTFTSQNLYAFDLEVDNTYANQMAANQSSSKLSYETAYSNLIYGKLIKSIPKFLAFKTRDTAYLVDVIRNQYLTFYSKKDRKLKATYDSGNYVIQYTQRW